MNKCKYVRESEIEKYTPMCCVEYDPAFGELIAYNAVHPDDVYEYCPFCGGKIKIKEGVSYERM